MGFEILNQINQSLNEVNEENKLRIMAWNGIIFNCIILWAKQEFKESPKQLAARLTEITLSIF